MVHLKWILDLVAIELDQAERFDRVEAIFTFKDFEVTQFRVRYTMLGHDFVQQVKSRWLACLAFEKDFNYTDECVGLGFTLTSCVQKERMLCSEVLEHFQEVGVGLDVAFVGAL